MSIHEEIQSYCQYIVNYASEHHSNNTLLALSIIDAKLHEIDDRADGTNEEFFLHGLAIAKMMIDLHLPIEIEEVDLYLSTALLHVLSKHLPFDAFISYLKNYEELDDAIPAALEYLTIRNCRTEEETMNFYSRLKTNKIALIVRIVERSNMVERLTMKTGWMAKKYILETKTYFLPLCIYAKEHHHELLGPLSILTEKIRNLVDISEILNTQFEVQEQGYLNEILHLQEENARIRGIINRLKA